MKTALLIFCLIWLVINGEIQSRDNAGAVTINEINIAGGRRLSQFVELRFSDHCLFRRSVEKTGIGPSLDEYTLLLIDGRRLLYNVFRLEGHHFSNSSGLFVISPDMKTSDFVVKPGKVCDSDTFTCDLSIEIFFRANVCNNIMLNFMPIMCLFTCKTMISVASQ